MDISVRAIRPISVYTATKTAAARASMSPYRLPWEPAESENAIRMLPARVMTMLMSAVRDRCPFIKMVKPRATQMTSVQTMAVELATVVWERDSNQNVKCRARKIPLTAQRQTVSCGH